MELKSRIIIPQSLIIGLSIVLLACSSNPTDKSKTDNDKKASESVLETSKPITKSEMVYFKGGTFSMGSANGTHQEQPVHEVEVQSFKNDKYTLTVGEFQRFVETTKYQPDADRFGDSQVFDFNSSGWALVPGANW